MPAFGGKLNSVNPSANTNTSLYAVTGRLGFNATISASNRNNFDTLIRIAIVDSLTISEIGDDDYIEYNVTLRPYGVLERSNVKIKQNKTVVVWSEYGNVSFGIWA